jgi:hypothetical protein
MKRIMMTSLAMGLASVAGAATVTNFYANFENSKDQVLGSLSPANMNAGSVGGAWVANAAGNRDGMSSGQGTRAVHLDDTDGSGSQYTTTLKKPANALVAGSIVKISYDTRTVRANTNP